MSFAPALPPSLSSVSRQILYAFDLGRHPPSPLCDLRISRATQSCSSCHRISYHPLSTDIFMLRPRPHVPVFLFSSHLDQVYGHDSPSPYASFNFFPPRFPDSTKNISRLSRINPLNAPEESCNVLIVVDIVHAWRPSLVLRMRKNNNSISPPHDLDVAAF